MKIRQKPSQSQIRVLEFIDNNKDQRGTPRMDIKEYLDARDSTIKLLVDKQFIQKRILITEVGRRSFINLTPLGRAALEKVERSPVTDCTEDKKTGCRRKHYAGENTEPVSSPSEPTART